MNLVVRNILTEINKFRYLSNDDAIKIIQAVIEKTGLGGNIVGTEKK